MIGIRPIVRREYLSPLTSPFQLMGQDQAAEMRDGDLVVVLLGFRVGQAKQDQGHALPVSQWASIAAILAG